MKFIQFPNGYVWPINAHGYIKGSVLVPGGSNTHDLDSFLDKLASAATDSCIGISNISYEARGGDLFSFSGFADGLPDFNDPEADLNGHRELDLEGNPDHLIILRQAWMLQYDLSEVEAQHAIQSLDDIHDTDIKEIALPVLGSAREFRFNAHPEPCSHVRVVVDGLEIGYWTEGAWAEDPSVVMGALMGVAGKGALRNLDLKS